MAYTIKYVLYAITVVNNFPFEKKNTVFIIKMLHIIITSFKNSLSFLNVHCSTRQKMVNLFFVYIEKNARGTLVIMSVHQSNEKSSLRFAT